MGIIKDDFLKEEKAKAEAKQKSREKKRFLYKYHNLMKTWMAIHVLIVATG